MRTLRLSRHAEEDILNLLSWGIERFGAAACRRYEALLAAAMQNLCKYPLRFGSAPRPELGASIRTYHLRFSREDARTEGGTVHVPRHILVYRVAADETLDVVRVLHDSMELKRHLAAKLDQEPSEEAGN